MKKILIMFLLSFPILIFAIVTFSSTIIANNVPLAVTSITVKEGSDIIATNKDEVFDLKFEIGPTGARNKSFSIYDEESRLLASYSDRNSNFVINEFEDSIIRFTTEGVEKFYNKEVFHIKVIIFNYGFTRLTIKTEDGGYEDYSDIYVADPNSEPGQIQGVVFDFTNIHAHYLFGTEGDVKLGYTYFPKQALDIDTNGNQIDDATKDYINGLLQTNAEDIIFVDKKDNLVVKENNVLGGGRGELVLRLRKNAKIETSGLSRNASFSFIVEAGHNIYTFAELEDKSGSGEKLFLLNNIKMTDLITFRNGSKLYGNGFILDHSDKNFYYDSEGNLINNGKYAITFHGNNSGLYNTHIIGGLDENDQPFSTLTNVGMIANGNFDRNMEVKDNIIENGRINLTIRGFSNTDPDLSREESGTLFEIDNNTLIGSFITAMEIDSNSDVIGARRYATVANISRTDISYTAVGLIIQSSRNRGGTIVLNLLEVDGRSSLNSTSWRNLDDASGAFSMDNFGYILKELKSKKYEDVYKRLGRDFYVNPIIMKRGGAPNYGIINFDNKLLDVIIEKQRPLNIFEAELLGGVEKFVVYLVNPKYFEEGYV